MPSRWFQQPSSREDEKGEKGGDMPNDNGRTASGRIKKGYKLIKGGRVVAATGKKR